MSILKSIYELIPCKKSIFSLVKRFYRPKFYDKLYFIGKFDVKVDDKKFKMFHYGYYIENEIFWKGLEKSWEPLSITLWKILCKSSDIIFDIGANTGIYSLVAQAVNRNSIVYAFEPVERTFENLENNVKINNFNIICVKKAVSNYDGKGIIYDSLKGNILSVTVNRNQYPDNNFSPVEIPTIKLDTFVKDENIKKIDLVKIDVETHEVEVLEGFAEYIHIFQPTLLVEILTDEVAVGIEKIISDINYLYFNIGEFQGVRLVDKLTKSDNVNFLICKREIAQSLNLI